MIPYATFRILIVIASFAGLAISLYIHHKKQAGESMVCPLRGNCETVVHSQYSRFFGIPLEYLGVLYYALVALSYVILLGFPYLVHQTFIFFVVSASLAAFLFSLYLTFIQLFALRQLCTWCLASACISTLIFLFSIISSQYNFVPLLAEHRGLLLVGHLVGVALGLGGATITDIFFFKFLKDYRISEAEADILHTLSQVIWFALGLLTLTGVAIFLPERAALVVSAKFLLKILIVGVIIVNGLFLNILIHPRLISISFGIEHPHQSGELSRLRRLVFALGAVSLVSWYSAFALGLLPTVPFSFERLLLIYLLALALAIGVSQLLNRQFAKGRV